MGMRASEKSMGPYKQQEEKGMIDRAGIRWTVSMGIVIALGLLFATHVSATPGTHSEPRWLLPSQGAYPDIKGDHSVWLRVSIPLQRVFVMSGNRRLYAMVASTGIDNPADDATPRGVYHIQRERGLFFYAPSEHEGAHYWVSWKNHGEYLFHTVPTDRQGRIIAAEARKLGVKASHGCIRLSVPDAKWIYENIPYGTRVVIGE